MNIPVKMLLLHYLRHEGFHAQIVDLQERRTLQYAWRRHFAVGVYNATGRWIHCGTDWHAFSYGFTPCLRESVASARFARLRPSQFVALSSNPAVLSARCQGEASLEVVSFERFLDRHRIAFDVYLFAPDYEWTFVLTHERQNGFGPYFARRGVSSYD
jgi:hypothetical protein